MEGRVQAKRQNDGNQNSSVLNFFNALPGEIDKNNMQQAFDDTPWSTPWSSIRVDASFSDFEARQDGIRFISAKSCFRAFSPGSVDYSYDDASSIKFKSEREPSIGVYLHTFADLATKVYSGKLIFNMILIGLNARDSNGQRIIPTYVNDDQRYELKADDLSQNEEVDWSNKGDTMKKLAEMGVKADGLQIVNLDVTNFKRWLESYCLVFFNCIFKNAGQIENKLANLKKGMAMLDINYEGKTRYFTNTKDEIKQLSMIFDGHIWRKPVASMIINAYAKAKIENNVKNSSYLSWAMMSSTYLMGYGIAKYFLQSLDILDMDHKQLFALFINDKTIPEINRYVRICQRILEPKIALQPATPSRMREQIYENWCGMIDDNYYQELRLKINPFSASICMGILDGHNAKKYLNNAQIISFGRRMYQKYFYDHGLLIFNSNLKKKTLDAVKAFESEEDQLADSFSSLNSAY